MLLASELYMEVHGIYQKHEQGQNFLKYVVQFLFKISYYFYLF